MNPIEFESVRCANARCVLVGAPSAAAPETNWPVRRPAQTKEPLHPSTAQWIRGLPEEVRPRGLKKRFARILNRLAERWHEPARCAPYLADLLIVPCDSREGFPPDVAMELDALTEYYQTLHRTSRPWQ